MKRILSNEDKKYLDDIYKMVWGEEEKTEEEPPKTFVDFASRKYKGYISKAFRSKRFTTWDDYALWLYYEYCDKNLSFYYSQLEDDLKAYSDMQTSGIEEAYDGYFYLKDKVPNQW